MNIITAVKVVADDQDITAAADGSLDMSKARPTISAYDLNAIEIAAQLAASNEGSSVKVLTAANAAADESKLKKNILARGVDELVMVADDACADMDAHATAQVLSAALEGEAFDLVICGDGSADNYAQQVDVQLAHALDVPAVNAVTALEVTGSGVRATRRLEDVVEVVELDFPCLVAVTPDIALPRIPGMKDILKAGKKPMNVSGAPCQLAAATQVVEVKAPEAAERKLQMANAADDGAIAQFAQALKSALQ